MTVTADDIIEETNKNCCICIDDHVIGSTVVKLPCGHLFHEACIAEWLRKSCMCPVCRFELETDDLDYERERRSRMKSRKLRMRRDELEGRSIGKLKDLMSQLGVSYAGCVDKRELVERLVLSGKIDVVEGVPPIEITESEISAKSVRDLKCMLTSFGLSADGMLDKRELIDRLIESGRVVIVPERADGASEVQESSSSPVMCEKKTSSSSEGIQRTHNEAYDNSRCNFSSSLFYFILIFMSDQSLLLWIL